MQPKATLDVVRQPDTRSCEPGQFVQDTAITLSARSVCPRGVWALWQITLTPDQLHFLALRTDWYLPDHEYTIACIWPVDPDGLPTGPPTCRDYG